MINGRTDFTALHGCGDQSFWRGTNLGNLIDMQLDPQGGRKTRLGADRLLEYTADAIVQCIEGSLSSKEMRKFDARGIGHQSSFLGMSGFDGN
jgi:hypothetical protein